MKGEILEMFCPLKKLELTVSVCPAQGCMYKCPEGLCKYKDLSKDEVSVKDIADIRKIKLYKVQAMASTAKQSVMLGATLLSYADYVKSSFHGGKKNKQTVNKHDSSGSNQIGKVLSVVFGLTPEQQAYFWDETRLTSWSARKGLTLTSSDIRTVLLAASI